MNVKEFFMGTKQEQVARDVVQNLQQRRNELSGSLPRRDQRQLDVNSRIAKRITRRRFLAGGGAVAAATIAGGVGWLTARDQSSVIQSDNSLDDLTPSVTQEPEITSIEEWGSLSSFDRLQKLFRNNTPELEGLDLIQETVKATAQFYTENLPSKFTAEELVKKTFLTTSREEFVDLAIQHRNLSRRDGSPPTQEEKESFADFNTAITTQTDIDKRMVIVNTQGIFEETEGVQGLKESWAIDYLEDHNLTLEIVHYTLSHEYGHVNNGTTTEEFGDESLSFSLGQVLFNHTEKLNIVGATPNGEVLELPFEEVLVEFQALELCEKAHNEISDIFDNNYRVSATWAWQLNDLAGIQPEEVYAYLIGKKSISDLFYAWGSLNKAASKNETKETVTQRGFRIAMILGLVVMGGVSQDQGFSEINSELTTTTSTFELTPRPVATP